MNADAIRRTSPRIAGFVLGLVMLAGVAQAAEPVHVRAGISPPTARIGERVTYRGRVIVHGGAGPTEIRWSNPENTETVIWGSLVPRYVRGAAKGRAGKAAREPAAAASVYDTAFVDVGLQVFETGVVSIPGLQFEVKEGAQWVSHRLPIVQMPIVPQLTAADSNAKLRPLRGPLGAPWWERVPWTIVIGVIAVLIAAYLIWRRLRRRKPAAAPALRPAVAIEDPAAEALRELAALRKLQLPEAGRFDEHAFALTKILRRFLERTRMTPRPGFTTPELVAHLNAAGLVDLDVERIATLLRGWDMVKFARAPSGADEARGAESAVEGIVRSGMTQRRGEAA
jgi:hypothetical protein